MTASPNLLDLLDRLTSDLAARGSVLVALSGGVDSAVVAAIARRAVGERALAVTAAAESLASAELAQARAVAAEIGIAHEIATYSELDDPEYVANPAWRCFVCQGKRMGAMVRIAGERGIAAVCDGTNASDPGPDRPGLAAVRRAGVYSPLLAHGVVKQMVRDLARTLGLSVAERPANACLSSRIPHGETVTLGKLRRVESAESRLHARGFRVVRVRHEGAAARVEVGSEEIARLASLWSEIVPEIAALGFAEVRLDPRGYRRGGADAPS
ncbi:MAG: ATP-dependent sacrificial sulfur transferase LarE [Thermoanaerobaculia bacterium]